MQTKIIYVYLGEGNSGVQTPFRLLNATESKTLTRLIADDGRILVNGDVQTSCIDVENDAIDGWSEIDKPVESVVPTV